MTIFKKKEWHYFNESNDLCKRDHWLEDDIELVTACGRAIDFVCSSHTENVSQVSCVKCLIILNKMEELKC